MIQVSVSMDRFSGIPHVRVIAWHGIDDTLTAHIVEVWQHTGQLPAPMRAVQS